MAYKHPPYLIRRNDTFSFRIGIPSNLRPILCRREIVRTLKTQNRDEAAQLALFWASKVKTLFSACEFMTRPITPAQLKRIFSHDDSAKSISELLTALEHSQPSDFEHACASHEFSAPEETRFNRMCEEMTAAEIALLFEHTDRLAPPEPPATSERYSSIKSAKAHYRSIIEAAEIEAERTITRKDEEIRTLRSLISQAEPKDTRTIHDIFERWKAKTETPSDASIRAFKTCIKKFDALYPDLPISEIKSEHFEKFTNHLRSKGAATNTVRKTVVNLKTLVNYACDFMELKTPGLGKVITPKKSRRANRRGYTTEELNLIFHSPLFSSPDSFAQSDELKELFRGKSGITAKDLAAPAAFWIPLIMCFTGARREEVCQLSTDRIVDRHGILCFSLETLDEADDLKTDNSYRSIPISSHLLKMGFAEFAEQQRSKGEIMLFPHLRSKGSKFGEKYGEAWSVYLRDHVGITDSATAPSHSFRHRFISEVRAQMRPSDIQDSLTGHIDQSRCSSQYGELYLIEQLQSLIEGCKFESVDFSHLYR